MSVHCPVIAPVYSCTLSGKNVWLTFLAPELLGYFTETDFKTLNKQLLFHTLMNALQTSPRGPCIDITSCCHLMFTSCSCHLLFRYSIMSWECFFPQMCCRGFVYFYKLAAWPNSLDISSHS